MSSTVPNYTQVPNTLLDNLAKYSDSELRVMLCMCRQTFGYHRGETISMSGSFIATATGMSRQGVINGTQHLMERNLVTRTPKGQSFVYEINLEPVNGVDRLADETCKPRLQVGVNGVDRFVLEPVNGVDTKKDSIKESIKEIPLPVATAQPAPNQFKLFVEGWMELYQGRFGKKYVFQNAKDGSAVKRIVQTDTAESLLALLSRAWANRDPSAWNCMKRTADIASFASAINAIRGELYNGRKHLRCI